MLRVTFLHTAQNSILYLVNGCSGPFLVLFYDSNDCNDKNVGNIDSHYYQDINDKHNDDNDYNS